MPSYTLAVATVLAVISFIASQLLVCINTHSRLCIQPPQLDDVFATGWRRWYPTTNRLLLLTISNETGINRDVVITSELATVHSTTPSHQSSLSDLQMTRLSSINWWPLGQNLLSIISDIILVMNIILVLLPLITSNPSSNDLNDIGSTTNLLQQLSLGPTHHQKQCSWLRSAEELMLLSSSPNRHNHYQQQSSPIIISTDTSHDLLWPARLQHPRACLTSATASLSLTDQHTLSLN